jgi:hypothetical protein
MKWYLSAAIALALTGCGKHKDAEKSAETSSSETSSSETSAPTSVVAVLKCRIAGNEVSTGLCLNDATTLGGEVKIKSDDRVHIYSNAELAGMSDYETQIPLHSPYEISVRVNSTEGAVIRLEIKDGGKTLHQDEASTLGTVYYTG